jgi:predicted Zn-dependent protease with MMP-like domain
VGSQPTLRRILLSAAAALSIGLGAASLIGGFSDSVPLRLLQGVAVFAAGAVVLGGGIVLLLINLAGWRDPESEEDFEALVLRAERLAADGSWGESDSETDSEPDSVSGSETDSVSGSEPASDGASGDALDANDPAYPVSQDEEFRALVRSAMNELPLEFHRALEHVAVVISDGGRSHRAYGLYQGDTVAHDYFHDRIVIFRDTLTADFGHDPELLKAQVTRTLRHELAHHLGWGEKGVRGLGL